VENWKRLSDFAAREQHKLRWLLRHADENGIVQAGVALKFGKEWHVNTQLLPGYLLDATRKAMGRQAA